MNPTLLTTLLGALGGFLGFVLSEMLRGGGGPQETGLSVLWFTAQWTAVLMLPLTLVLAAADNVLGLRGKWWRGLARIFIPALLLGLVSGAFAQAFYSLGLALGAPPRLTRATGWALMGAGVGLVLGLLDRSWANAWRGMLGGAVGGFFGGLVFDSFTGLSLDENDSGVLARLVGLTILGAAIGFMLRLSQELFKTGWLMGTTTGKYEGKQYILNKPAVSIGRSDGNDISLYHDQTVPMQAGTLRRIAGSGQAWHWQSSGETGGVLINGRLVQQAQLRHGDRLRLGSTELLFQEKGKAAPDTPFTQALTLHSNEQATQLPTPFKHLTLGTAGDVRLAGADILPRHAEIEVKNGALMLHALAPLRLNDQPVAAGTRVPLRPGDLLTLGQTDFALLRAELESVGSV
ncbi:FHA domain-containing protein [Deinococcus sp.]|uniref:FHA domain-containing protein n=1 Tax=Deinococcus sp. TaxID=47478 RepID=UPI0025BB068E|nr:FHA domain-containing protein [Deinococcus sp.]